MTVSRADRGPLATWWFTVDHLLVAAVGCLVFAGLVLSMAASPSVALSNGWPTFYFVQRHAVFAVVGTAVMIAVSLLSPRLVRRLAAVMLVLSLAAMVFVLIASPEINGAQRWLFVSGYSLQPSEFAKPAFIVLLAWLFAEAGRRRDVPALTIAAVLSVTFVSLLVLQPDIGQVVLVGVAGVALYVLAGLPLMGVGILGAIAVAGLAGAYITFEHVRNRFERFFVALPDKNSQEARAYQSFIEGGFFGRGPGEGTIKTRLPDAHTDFILAVVAEEYGVIACLLLLIVFAAIVLRALIRAVKEPNDAIRLGIQGLALLFGLQVLINMGVNVGLLPAKGMTLPFISAGGSSMLAISVTVGMLLALTRRRAGDAANTPV